MCLTIRLEPDIGEDRLRQLSESPAAQSLGWRFEQPSRLGRHGARLVLHGCDLLAEDADWAAPTWSMRPGESDRLADSIASLLRQAENTGAIAALWEGERAGDDLRVSTASFVELVRRSAMGTHTRYLVAPDGETRG
jgi:hypothetical protein